MIFGKGSGRKSMHYLAEMNFCLVLLVSSLNMDSSFDIL